MQVGDGEAQGEATAMLQAAGGEQQQAGEAPEQERATATVSTNQAPIAGCGTPRIASRASASTATPSITR